MWYQHNGAPAHKSAQPCTLLALTFDTRIIGYGGQEVVEATGGVSDVATRGLLETDHVILNNGQVTGTTPELAPPSPNYHTTPTGGRFSSRQI
ncbi:hypothetical protein TNCV_811521 [Trichonephila clavipes]|nr:hypothetical protein TNCV_811521 [Trichonephila clavipes]